MRRSDIWKLEKSKLEELVKSSTTFGQILSAFNLSNKGGNYKTLQRRLKEEEIDFSHIALGLNSNKGRKFSSVYRVPLETLLIENSNAHRGNLKERLLKEGLLKNQCYVCGQLPIWNDAILTLQLDHINGISNDNRIENLRILCPHCHSQTANFAGRNKRII